jgi:hypothetical protein
MKRYHVVIAIVVAVVLLVGLNLSSADLLAQVQSGEAVLSCVLQDGVKQIDPSLVVDYHPDFGWEFENGSAKNCSVN